MEMEAQLSEIFYIIVANTKCAPALASFSVLAPVIASSKSFLSCMARTLHLKLGY